MGPSLGLNLGLRLRLRLGLRVSLRLRLSRQQRLRGRRLRVRHGRWCVYPLCLTKVVECIYKVNIK